MQDAEVSIADTHLNIHSCCEYVFSGSVDLVQRDKVVFSFFFSSNALSGRAKQVEGGIRPYLRFTARLNVATWKPREATRTGACPVFAPACIMHVIRHFVNR